MEPARLTTGASVERPKTTDYIAQMAIRPIFETPDPVLRQISKPIETFDDELRTLVADMFETMYDAPGIGLAAVQVGEPVRLLVIDLQEPQDPDDPQSPVLRN